MSTPRTIRHDRPGYTPSGHLARPALSRTRHRQARHRQITVAHTAQATVVLHRSDTTDIDRPHPQATVDPLLATVDPLQAMVAHLRATTLLGRLMPVVPHRLFVKTEVCVFTD